MSHPDYAWSPLHYVGPDGQPSDPCRHIESRKRVGPTGRRSFMVLVDDCGRCGRILRSVFDLSWREYSWVRRWNARLAQQEIR